MIDPLDARPRPRRSEQPRSRGQGVRVTVVDLDTGESDSKIVRPGDYVLTTVEPCYVASVQAHPTAGTHVITVKGQIAAVVPEPTAAAGGGPVR